jgi:hypothetical protein
VTQYDSGRAFVSLGAPLTGLSASNNYAPNFVAPQQNPNFLTRFDKYEINYVTKNGVTSGVANLSSPRRRPRQGRTASGRCVAFLSGLGGKSIPCRASSRRRMRAPASSQSPLLAAAS